MHLPFVDWDVVEQAREFKIKHKPDLVISTGDLTDQKAWSRFLKEPDDDSPDNEWLKTQKAAKELAKMFPEMEILDSNHDRRYIKKAAEAGLPKAMIRTLEELFPYKGWHWRLEDEPVVYNNIAFMHGDELTGGIMAKVRTLGMSVVQGHSHKAELVYNCTFNKQCFGMDVGCMVDKKSAAFAYAKKSLTKVWVGFGYIQDGVPYLFPKKR